MSHWSDLGSFVCLCWIYSCYALTFVPRLFFSIDEVLKKDQNTRVSCWCRQISTVLSLALPVQLCPPGSLVQVCPQRPLLTRHSSMSGSTDKLLENLFYKQTTLFAWRALLKENIHVSHHYQPEHEWPSPLKPRWHRQKYEPIVLLHSALVSHRWLPDAHSFSSKHKKKADGGFCEATSKAHFISVSWTFCHSGQI